MDWFKVNGTDSQGVVYILNVMLVLTVNLIEPGIIWEMASGMLVEDFCTEMRR